LGPRLWKRLSAGGVSLETRNPRRARKKKKEKRAVQRPEWAEKAGGEKVATFAVRRGHSKRKSTASTERVGAGRKQPGDPRKRKKTQTVRKR